MSFYIARIKESFVLKLRADLRGSTGREVNDMSYFTDEMLVKIRMSKTPQYKLALDAGIEETLFSKLIAGRRTLPADDPRVVKLCEALGVDVNNAVRGGDDEGDC